MDERRERSVGLVTLGALVLALTGGLGVLVPSIHGLGATEFSGRRAMLAVLLALPPLGLATLLGRRRPLALAFALAWPVAVGANLALGQDPIVACLNWRVMTIDFAALPAESWGVVAIANHEQVGYSEAHDLYYACGPGCAVPAALQAEVGRDRW